MQAIYVKERCAPRPPAVELLLLGDSGILADNGPSTPAALASPTAAHRKKKKEEVRDCQHTHTAAGMIRTIEWDNSNNTAKNRKAK
jgi:hypothetical protein